MNQAILDEALIFQALGLDIILVDATTKNPGIVADWPTHKWPEAELRLWLAKRNDLSLAIRLGEVIDVEIDAEDAEKRKQLELAVMANVFTETPSWRSRRGRHWLFKLTDSQRNVLVVHDAPSVVKINGLEYRLGLKPAQSLLPTPGDDYRQWVCEPSQVTVAELPDCFFQAILADVVAKRTKETKPADVSQNQRPGDIFNERVTWGDILTPRGWRMYDDRGGVQHWTRPGKAFGLSATTGHCSSDTRGDLFYCFSSSCDPIEANKGYSKFELFTLLEHDGDFGAAAAAALRSGYAPDSNSDCSEFDDLPELDHIPKREKPPKQESLPVAAVDERPRLPESAYNNPIGKYALDLHNNYGVEADPAGVLLQALEIFGCTLGRNVWMKTEDGKLYPNGFLFVVGNKATGRKGTAWGHAKQLFKREHLPNDLCTEIFDRMIYGRVDSGEGLIKAMLDTQSGGEEFSDDAPIRFLMQDSEAIALLNKSKIENATLQQNMMKAWDGTGLTASKSKERVFVRKPHLSFIGHAQPIPLKEAFTNNMDYSGFMSRFKFIFIERCRVSFDPPEMPADRVDTHHAALEGAIRWASTDRELKLDPDAYGLCKRFYEDTPGIFREHRHVMKYAMMLAAMRQSATISGADVQMAITIQNFNTECFRFLFKDWGHIGERVDDEQKVLDYVRDNPACTLSDLSHRVFNRNKKHTELKEILSSLRDHGRIKTVTVTKGKNHTTGFTVITA